MTTKSLLALAALAATISASPVLSTRDTPLTPSGKKAGSAGGSAVPYWSQHLGWWYDWGPAPTKANAPQGVPMLWGDGKASDLDHQRFQAFQKITETPTYLLGFNEPDCGPPDSSNIDVDTAAQVWDQYIAPWGDKGSLLGSPAMCSMSPLFPLSCSIDREPVPN